MGIEYDITDTEKIFITITDNVSNDSLVEFMSLYIEILSSLKQCGQKRTLHVFMGGDTSISISAKNVLALCRFLHYKCRKLNKAYLDSIILYMNDKSVINLVKGFTRIITPVVPIRFYHLSTPETIQSISASNG